MVASDRKGMVLVTILVHIAVSMICPLKKMMDLFQSINSYWKKKSQVPGKQKDNVLK